MDAVNYLERVSEVPKESFSVRCKKKFEYVKNIFIPEHAPRVLGMLSLAAAVTAVATGVWQIGIFFFLSASACYLTVKRFQKMKIFEKISRELEMNVQALKESLTNEKKHRERCHHELTEALNIQEESNQNLRQAKLERDQAREDRSQMQRNLEAIEQSEVRAREDLERNHRQMEQALNEYRRNGENLSETNSELGHLFSQIEEISELNEPIRRTTREYIEAQHSFNLSVQNLQNSVSEDMNQSAVNFFNRSTAALEASRRLICQVLPRIQQICVQQEQIRQAQVEINAKAQQVLDRTDRVLESADVIEGALTH